MMENLLDKANELTNRENPLTAHNPKVPNPTLIILDHIITNLLDAKRAALALGCFTARDLDYLLPICKKVNKQIECVDSFEPLQEPIRTNLIKEIEKKYNSPLVEWTWDDGSTSKYLRSADYIYCSLDHRFPMDELMLSADYPCVWAKNNPSWLWPLIGQALYQQKLFTLIWCTNGLTLFTNSRQLKDDFLDTIPTINSKLKKINFYVDNSGFTCKLRSTSKTGDGWQPEKSIWKELNSL